jgi:hypothetical protein
MTCEHDDWTAWNSCMCDSGKLEPSEDCPIHGNPFPPQCAKCGQFMPYLERDLLAMEKADV